MKVGGTEQVRHLHLGSITEHTVFEGEVSGAILGLNIIEATPRATRATILLDNQAAIRALAKRPAKPGQHLVNLFHATLKRLYGKRKTLRLHIAWVPGHKGVEGNEQVDGHAKQAAEGISSVLPKHLKSLRSLPTSQAAAKAERKARATKEWDDHWNASRHRSRLARFDRTTPGKKILKLYKELPRWACSIITQLRCGHVGLNQYLARFNLADSPKCNTCQVPETVEHYLLRCRRFTKMRHTLRCRLGRTPLSMKALLGPKSDRKALLDYVQATGRFAHYSGCDGLAS